MKTFLLLSLLLNLSIPVQTPDLTNSPVTVTNFKWSRARRTIETPPDDGNAPQRAMIPQNRNFARTARINDPAGTRDPNTDTLDGLSAALEKSVEEYL